MNESSKESLVMRSTEQSQRKMSVKIAAFMTDDKWILATSRKPCEAPRCENNCEVTTSNYKDTNAGLLDVLSNCIDSANSIYIY